MIGIIALVFKSRMANTNTDITSETMNTDLKMVDMDSKIMDMDPKVVDMNSKTMDTDSKKTGSTTISSVGHSNLHCVIYNYWESNKEYSEGPHITLLLHATSNYLFYLEEQLKTWTGGISVSVFIPTPVNQQTEFSNILKSRFHVRSVFSALSSPQAQKLKNTGQISLHIFFRKRTFSQCPQLVIPDNIYSLVGASLSDMKDFEQLIEIYPINIARNIARKGSKTPLFISGDIEQFYVQGFESRIYQLAKKVLLEEKRKTVLVHRRFEIDNSLPIPKNKAELKSRLENREAVEFHRYYNRVGHQIPNLTEWLDVPENDQEITITDEIFYTGRSWEPQFVGDERVPFHDELFPYRYKTNAQLGLHLCFMNYTFSIVSDLFTIHPGILTINSPRTSYVMSQVKAQSNWAWYKFTREMKEIYPQMVHVCL